MLDISDPKKYVEKMLDIFKNYTIEEKEQLAKDLAKKKIDKSYNMIQQKIKEEDPDAHLNNILEPDFVSEMKDVLFKHSYKKYMEIFLIPKAFKKHIEPHIQLQAREEYSIRENYSWGEFVNDISPVTHPIAVAARWANDEVDDFVDARVKDAKAFGHRVAKVASDIGDGISAAGTAVASGVSHAAHAANVAFHEELNKNPRLKNAYESVSAAVDHELQNVDHAIQEGEDYFHDKVIAPVNRALNELENSKFWKETVNVVEAIGHFIVDKGSEVETWIKTNTFSQKHLCMDSFAFVQGLFALVEGAMYVTMKGFCQGLAEILVFAIMVAFGVVIDLGTGPLGPVIVEALDSTFAPVFTAFLAKACLAKFAVMDIEKIALHYIKILQEKFCVAPDGGPARPGLEASPCTYDGVHACPLIDVRGAPPPFDKQWAQMVDDEGNFYYYNKFADPAKTNQNASSAEKEAKSRQEREFNPPPNQCAPGTPCPPSNFEMTREKSTYHFLIDQLQGPSQKTLPPNSIDITANTNNTNRAVELNVTTDRTGLIPGSYVMMGGQILKIASLDNNGVPSTDHITFTADEGEIPHPRGNPYTLYMALPYPLDDPPQHTQIITNKRDERVSGNDCDVIRDEGTCNAYKDRVATLAQVSASAGLNAIQEARNFFSHNSSQSGTDGVLGDANHPLQTSCVWKKTEDNPDGECTRKYPWGPKYGYKHSLCPWVRFYDYRTDTYRFRDVTASPDAPDIHGITIADGVDDSGNPKYKYGQAPLYAQAVACSYEHPRTGVMTNNPPAPPGCPWRKKWDPDMFKWEYIKRVSTTDPATGRADHKIVTLTDAEVVSEGIGTIQNAGPGRTTILENTTDGSPIHEHCSDKPAKCSGYPNNLDTCPDGCKLDSDSNGTTFCKHGTNDTLPLGGCEGCVYEGKRKGIFEEPSKFDIQPGCPYFSKYDSRTASKIYVKPSEPTRTMNRQEVLQEILQLQPPTQQKIAENCNKYPSEVDRDANFYNIPEMPGTKHYLKEPTQDCPWIRRYYPEDFVDACYAEVKANPKDQACGNAITQEHTQSNNMNIKNCINPTARLSNKCNYTRKFWKGQQFPGYKTYLAYENGLVAPEVQKMVGDPTAPPGTPNHVPEPDKNQVETKCPTKDGLPATGLLVQGGGVGIIPVEDYEFILGETSFDHKCPYREVWDDEKLSHARTPLLWDVNKQQTIDPSQFTSDGSKLKEGALRYYRDHLCLDPTTGNVTGNHRVLRYWPEITDTTNVCTRFSDQNSCDSYINGRVCKWEPHTMSGQTGLLQTLASQPGGATFGQLMAMGQCRPATHDESSCSVYDSFGADECRKQVGCKWNNTSVNSVTASGSDTISFSATASLPGTLSLAGAATGTCDPDPTHVTKVSKIAEEPDCANGVSHLKSADAYIEKVDKKIHDWVDLSPRFSTTDDFFRCPYRLVWDNQDMKWRQVDTKASTHPYNDDSAMVFDDDPGHCVSPTGDILSEYKTRSQCENANPMFIERHECQNNTQYPGVSKKVILDRSSNPNITDEASCQAALWQAAPGRNGWFVSMPAYAAAQEEMTTPGEGNRYKILPNGTMMRQPLDRSPFGYLSQTACGNVQENQTNPDGSSNPNYGRRIFDLGVTQAQCEARPKNVWTTMEPVGQCISPPTEDNIQEHALFGGATFNVSPNTTSYSDGICSCINVPVVNPVSKLPQFQTNVLVPNKHSCVDKNSSSVAGQNVPLRVMDSDKFNIPLSTPCSDPAEVSETPTVTLDNKLRFKPGIEFTSALAAKRGTTADGKPLCPGIDAPMYHYNSPGTPLKKPDSAKKCTYIRKYNAGDASENPPSVRWTWYQESGDQNNSELYNLNPFVEVSPTPASHPCDLQQVCGTPDMHITDVINSRTDLEDIKQCCYDSADSSLGFNFDDCGLDSEGRSICHAWGEISSFIPASSPSTLPACTSVVDQPVPSTPTTTGIGRSGGG